MGLGKTLQVIGEQTDNIYGYKNFLFRLKWLFFIVHACTALFCHLYEMGVAGPFLVVAPLSTIPNWINEFKRFAPKVIAGRVARTVILINGLN